MYERDRKGTIEKAYSQGWLSGFDFSVLIQDFLISPSGYVIDTGNWENVNMVCGFLNGVVETRSGLTMVTYSLGSNDLHDGAEIKLPREAKPDEK